MTTKPRSTNSKKGPRSIAKDLRSAASALEHGRHSTAQKKLATIAPSFSPSSLGLRKDLNHDEAATTLAALRFWQEHLSAGGSVPRHFDHFEDATPLSIEEIDVLCEEINLAPEPQTQIAFILSLEDQELAVLDEALNSAENILTPLLKRYDSETLTLMFKQHVNTHLGVELSNIAGHGHRSDDPEDDGCTLTLFEDLTGLAERVAAGNTEYDRLEFHAERVLNRIKALGLGRN